MARYWLDSNVFIQSKNEYYGFNIAPGYWDSLKHLASDGKVVSPKRVLEELLKQNDSLSSWVKELKDSGLFEEGSKAVQQQVGEIATFVDKNWREPKQKAAFLKGADAWVVAHAKIDGGIVVTRERHVGENAKKVKIPNVCAAFGVEYTDQFTMMHSLGIQLVRP